MKKIIAALLVITLFSFAKCEKNIDSNGIPPATQEGKNTLGFLLNGQSWTPKGFNGTANLSLYYDASFQGGVFNLSAYKIISSGVRQRINIYGDSIQFAQNILLPNPKKIGVIFKNDLTGCDYDVTDTSTKITGGYFNIKKLDKTNNIFSAEFEIKFSKKDCEDVQITQGRFDMRY